MDRTHWSHNQSSRYSDDPYYCGCRSCCCGVDGRYLDGHAAVHLFRSHPRIAAAAAAVKMVASSFGTNRKTRIGGPLPVPDSCHPYHYRPHHHHTAFPNDTRAGSSMVECLVVHHGAPLLQQQQQ